MRASSPPSRPFCSGGAHELAPLVRLHLPLRRPRGYTQGLRRPGGGRALKTHRKATEPKGHGWGVLPDHLERELIPVPLSDEQKERLCEGSLVKIRDEITERLAVRPQTLFVKRFIRPVFAAMEKDGTRSVLTLPVPELPIETKSRADLSLLIYLAVAKFLDHLPLDRIRRIFLRQGVRLQTSSLCTWMETFHDLLLPVYLAMADAVKKEAFIHTDDTVVRAGCHAHARRYFEKALPYFPEAEEMLLFYRSLFEVERKLTERDATPAERLEARQDLSRPLLSKMKAWMEDRIKSGRVLPQSTLGKAIDYALGRWETLDAFLRDASLPLTNNISERAMRGVVLGRNNYLFFGSEKAAGQGAIFYSLLHSCVSLGIHPEEYLRDIAPRIGDHRKSRLLDLTPAGWLAAQNHSPS